MQSYFTESALKANTENGKDWLRKAIHPPSAKGVSYNGYPDKSVIPAIHQEYRLDEEAFIPCEDEPSTMLLLHCPGFLHVMFAALHCKKRPLDPIAGQDNVWILAQTNDQLSPKSIASEMGKVQTAYGSVTMQYDATGFNNSGMVYSAQFSPSIYTLSLAEVLRRFHKQGHLDKHVPILEKHYGKQIRDLAKMVSQSSKNRDDFEIIFNDNSLNSPSGISTVTVQIVNLGKAITQPTDISMLSPKKYTARSTEGAFIVHQTAEDYNKWCKVLTGSYNSGKSDDAKPLMLCLYESIDDNDISYLFPFQATNAGVANNYVYDVEWPNWTWAYTMFTNMQAGAAGGKPPMVNFKTIRGIAISPTIRSLLNASCVAPALYDPQALQTYTVITQSRQDAMPASFNMAGEAISAVATALPLIGSSVKAVTNAIAGADAKKDEVKQIAS